MDFTPVNKQNTVFIFKSGDKKTNIVSDNKNELIT
jgi:hypothetical protein